MVGLLVCVSLAVCVELCCADLNWLLELAVLCCFGVVLFVWFVVLDCACLLLVCCGVMWLIVLWFTFAYILL